ncbi:MAG: alanine:cation symporter family protein, partial [Clostridia bacterium]|nr:alanine:cation symporter family protein [Clostridia bacterium]
YIKDFFASRGRKQLGSALALLFALLCLANTFTMGSLLQVNAVAAALEGVFHIPPLTVGIVLAGFTWLVLKQGRTGVLKQVERLVPLMTLGYLLLSLAVLIRRWEALPEAFAAIFQNAFSGQAVTGGVLGIGLINALRYGCMRGLVSNEAGCGTAPTAHAVAVCSSPAEQGLFGLAEVFVDTIVLCTVTALVVIVGGGISAAPTGDFMMVTVLSYASVLGDAAGIFMAVAVLLFGVATVLCWAHYGSECVYYLSPRLAGTKSFPALYALSVLGGAVISASFAWQMADLAITAMTFLNLLVICPMSGEVVQETKHLFP